ncbi:MAG: cation diffusion facilitator family transporter [Clostridiales bacterium]|jgi:cation diffusion facilitator family transporter|nr:cation diffusion facilitator family transporter [Clostridiales bacterium]
MEKKQRTEYAAKVTAVNMASNLFLAVFKMLAGIFGHSAALISDAVDSTADIFSSLIAMIGIRISDKKSDEGHPYGHERFECVAAIILSVIILATGLVIGYNGVMSLIEGGYKNIEMPNALALSAAIVSIVGKEIMFLFTRRAAKKIQSGALRAGAWNFQTDALASAGSLIGIVGALLGAGILDVIASLVICLFILRTAVRIFIDAVKKMTDEACDEGTVEKIRGVIMECGGVLEIDALRTRKFGERIYVEAEIALPAELTFVESHDIAERVHNALEDGFPLIKHCAVHVNPKESGVEN